MGNVAGDLSRHFSDGRFGWHLRAWMGDTGGVRLLPLHSPQIPSVATQPNKWRSSATSSSPAWQQTTTIYYNDRQERQLTETLPSSPTSSLPPPCFVIITSFFVIICLFDLVPAMDKDVYTFFFFYKHPPFFSSAWACLAESQFWASSVLRPVLRYVQGSWYIKW